MMNFEKDFYELDQLLGGYFHQSWRDAFFWDAEPRAGDWEKAVRQYLYEADAQEIVKAARQLSALLALNLSEDRLENIIDNSTGSGFKPLPTHREFLEKIARILQEAPPQKEPLARK